MTFIDDNIFYPDTCVIDRPNGSINASTGEEMFDTLYSGKCGFNLNTSGDTTLQGLEFKSAPKLIIPIYNVLFKVNDRITVTGATGRVSVGSLKNYDPCSWSGMEGTTIWLKQNQDAE